MIDQLLLLLLLVGLGLEKHLKLLLLLLRGATCALRVEEILLLLLLENLLHLLLLGCRYPHHSSRDALARCSSNLREAIGIGSGGRLEQASLRCTRCCRDLEHLLLRCCRRRSHYLWSGEVRRGLEERHACHRGCEGVCCRCRAPVR